MQNYIETNPSHHPTMTNSERKCSPFKLVSYQKSAKKQQMDQEELAEA